MASESDELDDFFDSPRKSRAKNERKVASKSGRSSDISREFDFQPTGAKPPAHPHSRPTSAASSKRTVSGRSSSKDTLNEELEHEPPPSRRVIEAKIPTAGVINEAGDKGEESYSDESFDEEEESGRKEPTPRTKPCGKERGDGDRIYSEKRCTVHRDLQVKQCEPLSLSDYSDSCSDESDDLTDSDVDSEVTDVSPLSTPHSHSTGSETYVQRSSSRHSNERPGARRASSRQNGSTEGGLLRADSDGVDLARLLETVLEMESSKRAGVVRPRSGSSTHSNISSTSTAATRRRPNYSFSDDRVRMIERENERLMKSIMKHAAEAKKAKSRGIKPSLPASHIRKRPTSAAINRAKQMQKIEAENLMLLRKLQQTRPSHELRRDVLVGDFERLTGGTSGAARPSSAGRGLGSRPSSGKQRPSSASRHARPASVFPSRPDDDDILTWQPNI